MSILASLNASWQGLRAPSRERADMRQATYDLHRQSHTGPPKTKLGVFNRDSAAELGWDLRLLSRVTFGRPPESWDDDVGFRRVQETLGVTEDGWFGPSSYAAIMRRFGESIIVAGYPVDPPDGVVVRNWHSSGTGVRRLPAKSRRGRTVNMIVAHESVDSTWEGTQRTLTARGLGVHLMVAPKTVNGVILITQHADLIWDRCAHAESQNGASIGLEYVSPYYPESTPATFPPGPVLDPVGWADDGRDKRRNYRMLPPNQLEAGAKIIDWLIQPEGPIGTIPERWIGHDAARKRFALNRVDGDVRRAGVWAHTYTAHADAAVPVLYAWLRIVVKLEPSVAYEETVRLASTTGRWAAL